ncbi:DUF3857 domain-containing protein [Crocinitomix algicola]|uniref:DUF3857 domain-containing protein n=1 Tax=Crocinitomix algicola TaxID=1740263 RepID=UPI0009F1812E|nr:DUF3857 domain-containing protein [Crocinitomix algicola]
MQKINYLKGLLIVFITFPCFCFSYDLEEVSNYKKKFPENLAVILSQHEIVEIELDKKTADLQIFETWTEEVLYLKPTAKYYTSDAIYTSEFFEDIVSVDVTVYTNEGKKFKLKKDDFNLVDSPPSSWVFHDDDKELVFDLKELGEGYRTVISYKKRIKKPEFFGSFNFMAHYPIVDKQVEIHYPIEVKMKFYERNFHDFGIVKHQEESKKGMVSTWRVKEVKAFEKEKGATNMKNHIPFLIAQIESYNKNDKVEKLIGSVDDLHSYFQEFLLLSDQIHKGGEEYAELEQNKPMEDLVDSLLLGVEGRVQTIDTIFKWVQANIKYIAFEDGINGYVPRSCSKTLSNRYGDCKDMGNLLVAMLSHAGIDGAKVAWVGTRDIPFLMSEIPTPLACNHVICVVQKEDSSYFYLDATSSEGSIFYPPKGIQGKDLLIHDGVDEFTLFVVPPVKADSNYLKSTIRYYWDGIDSLRGSGEDSFSGYERERKTYRLNNSDDEDLYDYVKGITLGGLNRFKLNDFKIEYLDERKKPLKITYDFATDDPFIRHDSALIFNPTIFKPRLTKYNKKDHSLARFKNHHRVVDYTFEFEIPKGYEIDYIPIGTSFKSEYFHYQSTFSVQETKIVVNHTYKYHLLEIPPALYEDWNKMADAINASTIQNIILKKIK